MSDLYNVQLSTRAIREFREAAYYITHALHNESAASKLINKAYTAAESLEWSPLRNPFVRNKFLAAKGLRSMAVNNYSLFYVVREKSKTVFIISFMYSRRNWANLFSETDFADSESMVLI